MNKVTRWIGFSEDDAKATRLCRHYLTTRSENAFHLALELAKST